MNTRQRLDRAINKLIETRNLLEQVYGEYEFDVEFPLGLVEVACAQLLARVRKGIEDANK